MVNGNGFTEWDRPTWLPAAEWTPAQEWGQITGRQDPFWEARSPMEQLGERLQGRYLLGGPEYIRQTQEPSFEDFAGSWIGTPGATWQPQTYEDLLARARQAGEATRLPMGEYISGFDPQSDAYREAAWYGGMFNPIEAGQQAAAQRQLAAATLLARQRQGFGQEGAYGGQMGRLIANAVARQQRYQQDIGQPVGSFLDWYVSQVGQNQGVGEGDS